MSSMVIWSAKLLAMNEKRVITEGVLRPLRNPPAEPPGPRGTIALNPLTGLPFDTPAEPTQALPSEAAEE
jgi:hypothetical protein